VTIVDEALLTALGEGDAAPARAWLTAVLAGAGMSPARLSALTGLARWNDGDAGGSGTSPDATAALRQAVALTAGDPELSAVLALYVRHECEAAWEISWDHTPIRAAIASAASSRNEAMTPDVAAPAWALLQLLDREMLVESAAATGGLARLARYAGLAARDAAAVTALCAPLPADPLVAHLAVTAQRETAYYRALSTAAAAADRCMRTGDGGLAEAIAALAAAESDLADDDACRSELRAHRASLEALRAAAGRPWLQVTTGSVVYVFPLGLRGITAGRAVEALRETGAAWTLAGLPVTAVAPDLPLNDVWNGNDPLDREYAGAAVALPALLLPDPARARPHRLDVQVRLTELGNHCVRVEATLADAGPQELYAALLRAAPEAADLRELGTPLVPADGSPGAWGRLTDLASDITADLCGQFAVHAGLPDVQVSTRGGTYHAVLRVQEAGAVQPGTATVQPVHDPRELLRLVGGALLDHPVRHGVSAVAEWIRYPAGRGTRIDAPGLLDDLLLRSDNTTTIAALSTPSYMVDPLQEAAEFVATLDGLFAGWQVELADHYYRITREMKQLNEEIDRQPAGGEWDDSELDSRQRRLETAQHDMQVFVMQSRLRLMFITAPSLVTSPVMRTTIDHLLDAAGFEQARADFVGTVDDVVGDRAWSLIDTSVRRRQERAEERRREEQDRARRRMDVLLAAVAAVGISGILSILQAGYEVQGWASAVLAACALLTAAAAGAITHRLTSAPSTGRATSPASAARGGPGGDHPGR
jgi:hypothetical protein